VAVAAAVQGAPDLALGSVVGAIICHTGLILGVGNLMAPLPLDPQVVGRRGWVQLAAGALLVGACLPLATPAAAFHTGGHMTRLTGLIFLGLLGVYIGSSLPRTAPEPPPRVRGGAWIERGFALSLGHLTAGAAMVTAAAVLLPPVVGETARHLSISQGIIGATLVAFGTSLPKLVAVLAALRRGFGALAVGYVIGIDILTVLFAAGAAAALSPQGLAVPAYFFRFLFPAMMIILLIFRVGVRCSRNHLQRAFGIAVLAAYTAMVVLSYPLAWRP
jgi:cation:H+ antiporter